jgi:hypothetical protein
MSRSPEQQARRAAQKTARGLAFRMAGGPTAVVPGPAVVGQGCTGCNSHGHFALNCEHVPRLCGPCCGSSPGGYCNWHKVHMAALAKARAQAAQALAKAAR